MKKKSIKLNYIFNTCYQVLLLLTPLITTPYVSRVLAADGVGTISYAESIVSYFTLFASVGISTYGQREISYVQDSAYKRSVIFWNTKLFTFTIAGIVTCIYMVFALTRDNTILYLIFGFNLLSVLADVTWFYQGLEAFSKTVSYSAVFKLLSVLYIFVFVKDSDDLLTYAFGMVVFTFLGHLALWFDLKKYLVRVKREDIHPFKDFKVIWALFVPTIAVQIYTVLDKTMIGVITQSAYENGYYEQAIKIARVVLMLVASLGTVMIPRIGYHFQRQEMSEVKRLMYRGYRFVWFLGVPLCLGLMMTADNFVPWFFGDGYDKVSNLLKILSLLVIVIGISNVTGMQYLIPTRREKLYSISVISGACTNFILNMILISSFQSMGAAVASVFAEAVVAVVQIVCVRKELSPLKILQEGKNYFIAGAVMCILLYVEGLLFISSIINSFIMIATGAAIYFLVLLVLKDEFFVSNVKSVLLRFKPAK